MIFLLVYVIEPLRVQYGINLHECGLKRVKIEFFKTYTYKLIPYWTSKIFDYMLIAYWKNYKKVTVKKQNVTVTTWQWQRDSDNVTVTTWQLMHARTIHAFIFS